MISFENRLLPVTILAFDKFVHECGNSTSCRVKFLPKVTSSLKRRAVYRGTQTSQWIDKDRRIHLP